MRLMGIKKRRGKCGEMVWLMLLVVGNWAFGLESE